MIPQQYLKMIKNGKYNNIEMTEMASLFCFPASLVNICQECDYAFMGVTPFGVERFQCPNCKKENFIHLESYIKELSHKEVQSFFAQRQIQEKEEEREETREDKWYKFFMKGGRFK